MTVLAWLGIAVGALVALLLLVLALLLLVPVVVEAAWGDGRGDVSLAGPGLRFAFDARTRTTELMLFSRRIGRWSSGPGRRREREKKRRARSRPPLRKLWAERGRAWRALVAFFRRLRVRRLSLRATLATPDPALTGWLAGAVYAARAMAPPQVRRGVEVTPDFLAEAPRLALDAAVRVRPVHAAILAVRLWRVAQRARGQRPAAGTGTGAGGSAPDGGAWWRRAARRTGASRAARHDGGSNRREGGGRERP